MTNSFTVLPPPDQLGNSLSRFESTGAESVPLPARPRYLSLDMWRGLACLMIVVWHASLYMTVTVPDETKHHIDLATSILVHLIALLQAGVPMFFVISGYCIAATADSTRRKSRPIGEFFARRFRRIFPPFWIFIELTALVVGVTAALGYSSLFSDAHHPIHLPWALSVFQWLGNVTLTETWRFHLFGEGKQFLSGQAWTLCYEEQFYAVCGLVLMLSARRFFTGMVVVTVLTLALQVLAAKWHWDMKGFFFDGHWFQFAAGVLIYYQRNYVTKGRSRVLLALLGCAAVVSICRTDLAKIATGLSAALVFACLLGLLQRWDEQISRALILRPLSWCGVMCYSLYLVHWPVVKAVSHLMWLGGIRGVWPTLCLTIPVAAAIAIAASWAFHCLVERHFLNPMRDENPIVLANAKTREPGTLAA
jgi:peptidoglycan/LPS O-acetylase OafA/YrhL